jgi:hypothetical protein
MYQATLFTDKIRFEQFEDAPVLIHPARRFFEAVIFNRKHSKLPILLFQFNEPLNETHGILEMNVLVNDSVANQKCTPETIGEVDRRALTVCQRVLLRNVENL